MNDKERDPDEDLTPEEIARSYRPEDLDDEPRPAPRRPRPYRPGLAR